MFDPLNEEATPRDYVSPVEEKEVKSLNEGSSNKNYVFNNCSVTINEEGKAIDVLQAQESRKAKMQEAQVKMIGEVMATITTTITSLLERKAERIRKDMSENTGEPVMTDLKNAKRKRASAKKKAPAKKVVKKK
jgi:hypothetical protein